MKLELRAYKLTLRFLLCREFLTGASLTPTLSRRAAGELQEVSEFKSSIPRRKLLKKFSFPL
jgi:hypothetical protein